MIRQNDFTDEEDQPITITYPNPSKPRQIINKIKETLKK